MSYGQYLKRNRCGTLVLRLVIPRDVRALFGRTELSVSLGGSTVRQVELRRLQYLRKVCKTPGRHALPAAA